MFVLIFSILVLLYAIFVVYQVVFENRSLSVLKTWNPFAYEPGIGTETPLSADEQTAPSVAGLKCRFPGSDILNNKTFNKDGDSLDLNKEVSCTGCNQYIYKSDGKCSLYEYDKDMNERGGVKPSNGTCTSRQKIGDCPF